MTESEIERAIDETRTAIQGKTGKRASYSATLKEAILSAAEVMGASEFARVTGLLPSLISQWKRASRLKGKREGNRSTPSHPVKKGGATGFGARELKVIPNSFATGRPGVARIRAGEQIEIEVPLEMLTPEWVSSFIGKVQFRNGAAHV